MFNIFGFLKRKKKEQPKVSPAPITANPSAPSDDPSMSFAVAAMTDSALAGYVAGKNLPFAVLGEVISSSSSSSTSTSSSDYASDSSSNYSSSSYGSTDYSSSSSYDSGYSSSSSSSSFGD